MTSAIRHEQVDVGGISMHVAEAGERNSSGARPPVVLCHGWPELWYSWRHQLPALAAAGHHVLAPDQRGYGGTSRPESIADYDIEHLTDDLVALLDSHGYEDAVFVGHDWGSMVVWAMAQRFPERVRGVCGMSVAFTPRGQMSLTDLLRTVMGDRFFYILYFQQPGVAESHMDRDPRDAMRRVLTAISGGDAVTLMTSLPAEGTTFWDWLPPVESLPAWLSEADLDVFASAFSETGFRGGINWYRNFHRNWEISEAWGTRKIEMPAAFVVGSQDPVLQMTPPSGMEGWVTDLREVAIVEGAGHWVQQERPDEVNEVLLRFLSSLSS